MYLDDHKPLPGITIGDIGTKVPSCCIFSPINLFISGPKACGGHSPNDNGFARFDRVRIPKENMLSGFAQVTSEGEYVQPPHAKLSYGGVSSVFVA
jgi:acyl-CoA oxidase